MFERVLAAAQLLDNAGFEAAFDAALLGICAMTRPSVRKAGPNLLISWKSRRRHKAPVDAYKRGRAISTAGLCRRNDVNAKCIAGLAPA
jgi:hypothetical protein